MTFTHSTSPKLQDKSMLPFHWSRDGILNMNFGLSHENKHPKQRVQKPGATSTNQNRRLIKFTSWQKDKTRKLRKTFFFLHLFTFLRKLFSKHQLWFLILANYFFSSDPPTFNIKPFSFSLYHIESQNLPKKWHCFLYLICAIKITMAYSFVIFKRTHTNKQETQKKKRNYNLQEQH